MLSLKVASGADSSGSPAGGQDAAPADGAGLGALQPTGECPFVRGWGGGRGGRGREGGGVGVCVCVCARAEWGGGAPRFGARGGGWEVGTPPSPPSVVPSVEVARRVGATARSLMALGEGRGGPASPPPCAVPLP